ncbi:MAG: eCIS core domain-containing protein [Myxococcota bacterium]
MAETTHEERTDRREESAPSSNDQSAGGASPTNRAVPRGVGYDAQARALQPPAPGYDAQREARKPGRASGALEPSARAAGEAALGVDLGDVRVHAGDGRAEAAGAAGLAEGRDVHVARAAVGSDGRVEPGLLAHEIAHVAQQTGGTPGGPGESGGGAADPEAEAHAASEAIQRGEPTTVSRAPAGPMRWDVREWFRERYAWLDEAQKEAAEQQSGVETKARRHVGTNEEVMTTAPGGEEEVATRKVGGSEEEKTSGWEDVWSLRWLGGPNETKDRTTTYDETSGEGGAQYVRETTDRGSTSHDPLTGRTSSTEGTTRTVSERDHEATARAVASKLEGRKKNLEARKDELRAESERLKRERQEVEEELARFRSRHEAEVAEAHPDLSPEERRARVDRRVANDPDRAGFSRRRGRLEAKLRDNEERIREADGEASKLATDIEAAKSDPRTAVELARAHDLEVEPVMRERTDGTTLRSEGDVDVVDRVGSERTWTGETVSSAEDGGHTTESASLDYDAGFTDEGVALSGGAQAGEERTDASGAETYASTERREVSAKFSDEGAELGTGRSEATREGGVETSSSTDTSVILRDGEKGASRSTSRSTTEDLGDDRSVTTERKASGELTNREASGTAESSKRWKGKTLERGVKTSGDGRLTVEVNPLEGEKPPKYEIVVKVHLGAGVSGDVEHTARGEGDHATGEELETTGSAHAEGAADFTQTRVFGRDQAMEYLGKLEQTRGDSEPSSDEPEFGVLAKARAMDDMSSGGLAAMMGDGSAARGLGAGESFSMTVSGEAGADAGTTGSGGGEGGTSVGVEGGASGKWSKTVSVNRVTDEDTGDRKLVDVKVDFTEKTEWEARGSADMKYASGSVGGGASSSSGQGRTFRLDATSEAAFDEKYALIMGATTPSELAKLADSEALQADVTSKRTSEGRTSRREGNVSAAGMSFDVSNSEHYSATTEAKDGELTGTREGGQTDRASLGAGGLTVGSEAEHSATGHVGSEGELSVDVTTERKESSVGWAGLPDTSDEGLLGTAGTYAGGGARGLANELFQRTETTLHGYHLSPEDARLMVGRATNESRWKNAAVGLRVLGPLITLRGELLDPRPDPSWTEGVADPNDPQVKRAAENLARAEAIARFMERTGGDGKTTIRNVLQRWGDFDDLGMEFEWPPSISDQQGTFEGLEDEVPKLVGDLESATGPAMSRPRSDASENMSVAGPRIDMGLAERYGEVDSTISGLHVAIEGCEDFDAPRAKAEMLAKLNDYRFELRRAYYAHVEVASPEMAVRGDDGLTKSRRMLLQRSVRDRQRMFRTYAEEEKRFLDRAREEMDSWSLRSEQSRVNPLFAAVENLHDRWEQELEELESLYRELGKPPEVIERLLDRYGPDTERYERLHDEYSEPALLF